MRKQTRKRPTRPDFYWLLTKTEEYAVQVVERDGNLWVLGQGIEVPLELISEKCRWEDRCKISSGND